MESRSHRVHIKKQSAESPSSLVAIAGHNNCTGRRVTMEFVAVKCSHRAASKLCTMHNLRGIVYTLYNNSARLWLQGSTEILHLYHFFLGGGCSD